MIDLVLNTGRMPLGNGGRSTSQLTLIKRAKCRAFDFHSRAHKAVQVHSMKNNGLCTGTQPWTEQHVPGGT